MLTSITPLGERGRNRSWPVTMAAYLIGSILGGGVVGAAAGSLGGLVVDHLSRGIAGAIIAGSLFIVAADELGLLRFTPLGSRQVNEDWLDEYRGWVVGVGFGFQLGLGFVTIVTSLAVPATLLMAFLTASWQWGLAVGATFGLARALPIFETWRVTEPGRLAALHRRHDERARYARWGTALAVVPLAIMAVIG